MNISGFGIGEILVLGGLAGMAGTAVLAAVAVLVAAFARREETTKNRRENGG